MGRHYCTSKYSDVFIENWLKYLLGRHFFYSCTISYLILAASSYLGVLVKVNATSTVIVFNDPESNIHVVIIILLGYRLYKR